MTDCFQPAECEHQITLKTIELLNYYRVGYLIVTKSSLIAEPQYLDVLDKQLSHIQISVTCLDDKVASKYEKASSPSQRIHALFQLQSCGFDVAVRLSPLMEDYMDFEQLNSLSINSCIVEFLRVNSWIKKWFSEVDYSKYTLRQSGYYHLPLEEKQRILKKIKIGQISVCEDVTDHYYYWQREFNPNKKDCCNLKK